MSINEQICELIESIEEWEHHINEKKKWLSKPGNYESPTTGLTIEKMEEYKKSAEVRLERLRKLRDEFESDNDWDL